VSSSVSNEPGFVCFGVNVTWTEICIFAWAILGMIEVAILLHLGGLEDERQRRVPIDVGRAPPQKEHFSSLSDGRNSP
jgi:hypothetical protein